MKMKLISILLIFFAFLSLNSFVTKIIPFGKTNFVVHAEDEEEHEEDHEDKEEHEEDHEDEDHEDEDEHRSSNNDTQYVEYVVYEGKEIPTYENSQPQTITETVTVPVIKTITVIDDGYDIDTDGDLLVDAIDPHPEIHEKLLFTDTDNDGVPDATDAYPDEDDFLYILFPDENQNGISDFLEL